MRIKTTKKLAFFCIISAFSICGFVACNSDSDSKNTDKGMSSDSSAKMAGTTDSTMKDTTAMAAKPAKKKRKASVAMSAAGTDKIAKDKDGIYNRAEIMPQYPGGENALSTFINDHVDYTQAGNDDNAIGTVRVSFVVDENGKVIDVHLMGDQKMTNGLGDQAVKVISSLPAWTPGKVKGKNVKTRLELPISFELQS